LASALTLLLSVYRQVIHHEELRFRRRFTEQSGFDMEKCGTVSGFSGDLTAQTGNVAARSRQRMALRCIAPPDAHSFTAFSGTLAAEEHSITA
jgi:hypothetical protein